MEHVKYDFRTVGANDDPCDGWALIKLAPNCHEQKIGEGMTRDEAALFAAAPDLLAALKQLVNFAAPHSPGSKYITAARAAIAKAEGGVK